MQSQHTVIPFSNNHIYEFKIDFYKTGRFDGPGFYDYCKVIYDPTNNNYKIYSYYSLNKKLHPTKPTREGKYSVIEYLRHGVDEIIFKGPIFTDKLSPKFGQYDEWILNTKQRFNIS